jgi:hypothetical protein
VAQRGGDVVVRMDRPVVLDDGDAPRRRRNLRVAPVEGADLLAADQIVVQVVLVHLASERVAGADEALRAVGRPGRVHLADRPRYPGTTTCQSGATSGQR